MSWRNNEWRRWWQNVLTVYTNIPSGRIDLLCYCFVGGRHPHSASYTWLWPARGTQSSESNLASDESSSCDVHRGQRWSWLQTVLTFPLLTSRICLHHAQAFCYSVPFNISATAEVSDFKFGMQFGFSKAHHKITLRRKSRRGPGLGKLLKIWGSPLIFLQRLKVATSRLAGRWALPRQNHKIPPRRKSGRGHGLGKLPDIWGFSL